MSSKKLLFCVCLLLLSDSIFSQSVIVPPKTKNIILLVGDGMGVSQIYAGLTANKGSLNLERIKCIGFSKTNSVNNYITDSGAGATAFAIGEKTNNLSVGVDSLARPMPSILEIAMRNGLSAGLVSSTDITDATPAAFVAHVPLRKMQEEIALDFLKSNIDLFIGGGKDHFTNRKDGRNLTEELRKKGYHVSFDIDEISKIKEGKIAGLVLDKPYEERGEQLMKSAKIALNILSQNEKGFFLMLESSYIDHGGHKNNLKTVVSEMLDFDRVIGEILNFAEKNGETLVVITGDHETGGLTLTGGDLATGEVEGKFSTTGHTGVMVPVFAFGPGAEEFMGFYHNNMIFHKFMDLFQFIK